MGADEHDSVIRVAPAASVRTEQPPAPPRRAILFVDYAPNVDPAKKRRKDVRSHAATASAAKRKATIAKKQAQQRLSRMMEAGASSWEVEHYDAGSVSPSSTDSGSTGSTISLPPSNAFAFRQLVELVTELQGDRVWYLGPIERSSLAHKAIRSILWDAMINSATLFQAAGFVAATHCNSCGLPSTAVHMGSGLLLLRGASFNAVQNAITAAETDSLTPVSIAMLAGWERRYGDQESFQVHMQAWRSLSLPPKALEENHVATLTDLTLETFRETLNERSDASAGGFRIVNSPQAILDLATLPPGFKVFNVRAAESRSLLELVSQLTHLNPRATDAILQLRRLSLENLAWSPYHTHSIAPVPAVEDAWDQVELNALYHVRAAMISLISLTLAISSDYHQSAWQFDVKTALAVHTASCQHLGSDALLDTKFKEGAVWARFILCAVSRDPPRDDMIRQYLRALNLTTWEQVRSMLQRYIYYEPLCGPPSKAFYALLCSHE